MTSCLPKATSYTPIQHLGRYLFFDNHLSLNHSKSCGTCHSPQFAFTDGYRLSVSALGESLLHNSPSLLNTNQYHFYDWANPVATDYIKQMQRPLYGTHPVELGLNVHWDEVKKYLAEDDTYKSLFGNAFPTKKESITQENIVQSIAAYVQGLTSENSKYDQYKRGDKLALNESELKGMKLFESEKLACSSCHTAPSFTQATITMDINKVYVNTGLYNINEQNQYPTKDAGLYSTTKKESDNGKFKIPSLRNVAITSPYMHDGTVNSLSEVIDIYAKGGRTIDNGDYRGNGIYNKNKNSLVHGFTLSENEKNDLMLFLIALTDTSYLSNDYFLNPFRIQ